LKALNGGRANNTFFTFDGTSQLRICTSVGRGAEGS
jgi:hypothetical protein